MIVFQTNAWSWDLTNFGLDFTEESAYFEDVLTKSFSFPITIELNEGTAYKLGLVHLENIKDYANKIFGTLIIDNNFYESYLSINNIVGTKAEVTFFYGKETLSVFDKKLKDLPFNVIVAPNGNLPAYAKGLLSTNWPEASHQFISVFRDDLSSKSNYKDFEGWLNQMVYSESTTSWEFVENTNETIEGKTVAVNRNVMVPMTYLLEILKVGFKTEGLEVRGDMVEDNFFKKVLFVPKIFMEQFAVTQFLNYSFSDYTTQEQIGSQTINVYQQTHQPQSNGSYALKIRVNFTSGMGQYFNLTVVQDGETLYEVFSENTTVNINKTLNISIVNTTVFQDIIVIMKLVQQSAAIAQFNNFTYEYKEGQLNVFPSVYTLADYMPDMTFRAFFNRIKNWLNLDPVYTENAVYLNFLENRLDNFRFIDRTHLETPEPRRETNNNNLFKIKYPIGEEILVNKFGQTFDDSNITDEETKNLNFEVLPLNVLDNFGKVTAVYPEDDNDLMLTLYESPAPNSENLAINELDNSTFSIQDIYNKFWQRWLTFRANSETIKDSFKMHATEAIDLREGEFKYNKKRLILKLRKKRISTEFYQVDITSETF